MKESFAILALSLSLLIAVAKPVCLWLRLRFLRYLFDRGGVDGMTAGADALARSSGPGSVDNASEASAPSALDAVPERRGAEGVNGAHTEVVEESSGDES